MRTHSAVLMFVVLVALVGVAAPPNIALAFDVDTTADGSDADPGDGFCATFIGPCTLRAAIEEANALGGAHTVNLPQGEYHAGNHLITADISLLGPAGSTVGTRPSVIGGGPTFTISSGALVSMTDVSILLGDGTGVGTGCLRNEGNLELTRVGLYSCSGIAGGAILNEGVLAMTDGEVEDSQVFVLSTQFEGYGGGLINASGATATLAQVAFHRNYAERGGGAIANLGGTLSLTDCWLDDNSALGSGGGLVSTSSGVADLTRVTVSRNHGDGVSSQGGGIWAAGALTLRNVTVHSNRSEDYGGGVYLESGAFVLVNVTLMNNNFDGLATGGGATVQVANTLFYQPSSSSCQLISPISSFGHNLETTDTCGLNGPGDLVNSALITLPPGLHGGFGETVPLAHGSPGIDDGDDGLAPETDQRGVARHDGDGDGTVTSDIGAYEYDMLFGDGFESGDTTAWSDTVPP